MARDDQFDEELLVLTSRRLDFLEALSETAQEKRELVDVLGHSRSTVNRAIDELEAAGLVAPADRGYETTATGRLAADLYRQMATDAAAIQEAADVLGPLPADSEIELELISGADVERIDGPPPYSSIERIRRAISDADEIRAFMPTLANLETLRACHTNATQDGTSVELVMDSSLFDRLSGQFTDLFSDLSLTDDYRILTGAVPQVTAIRIESAGEITVAVVVYTEENALHGVLTNTSAEAVRWFDDCYDALRTDATDRTDDLIELAADDGDRAGEPITDGAVQPERDRASPADRPPSGPSTPAQDAQQHRDSHRASEPARLPLDLEAEGFVRLSPAYFERHAPQPPAVCLRTGLDLTEVHAGYAIDREFTPDGERRNLTTYLVDALQDGTDHVVIGPPGSGKSTVCKSVACRWYEQGRGPVFYRDSGYGQPFDSWLALERQLQQASGHALVVVEDAVRAEANQIFKLMAESSGESAVSFLLDSRQTEWQQPKDFPTDARLEAYRQEAIETVVMPTLDRNECRRLVRHFDETIPGSVVPSVQSLLSEIDIDSPTDTDGASPGNILLFLHRLASYADPLSKYDSQLPTTLTEDITQTYDRLQAADNDRVLDVGVLVNILNAIGVGVYPELVHAVASEGEHETVREALSILEGRIIFEATGRTATDSDRYRSVHESWSRLFLEQLPEIESKRGAQERFGRCVTALLSLADDAQLRERIDWEFEGEASYISEITLAPTEWADDTVRRLFVLGQEYPSIAPLFGKSEYSYIELPAACSPDMHLLCTEWRGEIYRKVGDHDRAAEEYERLATLAEESDVLGPEESQRKAALSLTKRGEIQMHQGQTETAEELVSRGLDLYQDIDDDRGKAASRLRLGILSLTEGDPDGAEDQVSQSLDRYRDLDDPAGESRCLGNLAVIALRNGALDDAAEYASRSLEVREALGFKYGQAESTLLRGKIAIEQADFDEAADFVRRSFELAREVGATRTEANSLLLLGEIAHRNGDNSAASDYLTRSLDLWEEIDVDHGKADCLRKLGTIRWDEGEYDAAEETLTESLEIVRTVGDTRAEAETLIDLGELAFEQDAVDLACERFDAAIEIYRDSEATETALETLDKLIDYCESRAVSETGIEYCGLAIELAEAAGLDDRRQTFETRRGRLSEETAQ